VAVGYRIGDVNNSPSKRGDGTQSATPPPSHQYGQQKKTGRRRGVTCLAVGHRAALTRPNRTSLYT